MSRVPGFYKFTPDERVHKALSLLGLEQSFESDLLRLRGPCFNQLCISSENVVSSAEFPLSLAPNFTVNGVPLLVPMSTEEPSVVAAASRGAVILGDIRVIVPPAQLWGQIQMIFVSAAEAEEALALIGSGPPNSFEISLINHINSCMHGMVSRGGGILLDGRRPIEASLQYPVRCGQCDGKPLFTRPSVTLRFLFHTCAAFGANAVNSALETASPRICELFAERMGCHPPRWQLRIMSNYCPERTCMAEALVPFSRLGEEGIETALRICEAANLAHCDDYRRATHNKGILNGILAVAQATGQDTRALSVLILSSRDDLTTYEVTDRGLLVRARIPIVCGVVGGAAFQFGRISIQLLAAALVKRGMPASPDNVALFLPAVMVAVGMANNIAALHALVCEGIQSGHMKLHAANLMAQIGTPPELVEGALETVFKEAETNSLIITPELIRKISAECGGNSTERTL